MRSGLRYALLASSVVLGACSVDVDTSGQQPPAQKAETPITEAPAKKDSPACTEAMAIENMAIGSVLTSAAKALSAPEGSAMEAADDIHRRATEHARNARNKVIELCLD